MNVNFEFLDNEAIENVITCLNYPFDKVIFFGYEEIIRKRKKSTERFLKGRCSVKEVEFYPVSDSKPQDVRSCLESCIERELSGKNNVFFDITGGENLILVAFGMLSAEKKLPIHMYDVETGRLIEWKVGEAVPLSEALPPRPIPLDLDAFIEMRGGIINYRMDKALKHGADEAFDRMVPKLWKVSQKHEEVWNSFSDFIKQNSGAEEDLFVRIPAKQALAYVRKSKTLNRLDRLERLLDDCAAEGILEKVHYDEEFYEFCYPGILLKECIRDAGSILELYIYQQERQNADDCRIGIHLDWDGVIGGRNGDDVLNEVDVLVLNGYVPTFISCKNGHADKEALYELDAVTRRFGGKYAKKVLAAPRGLSKADKKRAQEMRIELRW